MSSMHGPSQEVTAQLNEMQDLKIEIKPCQFVETTDIGKDSQVSKSICSKIPMINKEVNQI